MNRRYFAAALLLSTVLGLTACAQTPQSDQPQAGELPPKTDLVTELGLTPESKDASTYTAEVHSAIYSLLDFEDSGE